VLPVEPMVENNALGVQLVQNSVGVVLVTCREDYNLPFFSHLLQEGQGIGTNRETNCYWVTIYKNMQSQIGFTLSVVVAVNESLVEVENESFHDFFRKFLWQYDRLFDILIDIFQRVET
jgi:hypothetical protein